MKKQWAKRGLDGSGSKQVGSTAECPKQELKISSQEGRGDLGKRNKHTSGQVQKHDKDLVSVQVPLQEKPSDAGAQVQLP